MTVTAGRINEVYSKWRTGGVKPFDAAFIAGLRRQLDVKAEVDDIAVSDDVVLAFEAELPRLAAFRLAAITDEVFVGNDFGADKPALDVAVNLSRGFPRRRPLADRPRLDLVFAGGEKTDEIEQLVRSADEAVADGL